MYSKGETPEPDNRPGRNNREETKDLREANDNVRTSRGDDPTGPVDSKKAGNKPAFDRDR